MTAPPSKNPGPKGPLAVPAKTDLRRHSPPPPPPFRVPAKRAQIRPVKNGPASAGLTPRTFFATTAVQSPGSVTRGAVHILIGELPQSPRDALGADHQHVQQRCFKYEAPGQFQLRAAEGAALATQSAAAAHSHRRGVANRHHGLPQEVPAGETLSHCSDTASFMKKQMPSHPAILSHGAPADHAGEPVHVKAGGQLGSLTPTTTNPRVQRLLARAAASLPMRPRSMRRHGLLACAVNALL